VPKVSRWNEHFLARFRIQKRSQPGADGLVSCGAAAVPMYLTLGLVVAVPLALARAVPAVIALCRADRKDIPAVVRAMARWWRK
jgi:hypothetical protein